MVAWVLSDSSPRDRCNLTYDGIRLMLSRAAVSLRCTTGRAKFDYVRGSLLVEVPSDSPTCALRVDVSAQRGVSFFAGERRPRAELDRIRDGGLPDAVREYRWRRVDCGGGIASIQSAELARAVDDFRVAGRGARGSEAVGCGLLAGVVLPNHGCKCRMCFCRQLCPAVRARHKI